MAVIWGLWTMRTPSGWRVRPSAADIDQNRWKQGPRKSRRRAPSMMHAHTRTHKLSCRSRPALRGRLAVAPLCVCVRACVCVRMCLRAGGRAGVRAGGGGGGGGGAPVCACACLCLCACVHACVGACVCGSSHAEGGGVEGGREGRQPAGRRLDVRPRADTWPSLACGSEGGQVYYH